jgi:hypothetical protein
MKSWTNLTHAATAVLMSVGMVALGTGAGAQTPATREGEVTLIGCVEMERDYRARKESGRGGALGSGVGVGNEFVLTNAKPVPAGGRRGQAVGTGGAPGMDYEIGGKLEKDMLRYVGRQVEVIGTIEKGSGAMSSVNVTLWHPVGDYCPAK